MVLLLMQWFGITHLESPNSFRKSGCTAITEKMFLCPAEQTPALKAVAWLQASATV